MYNLLSDKLDRFERQIRMVRNRILGKSVHLLFQFLNWFFVKCRPYIHTDYLKTFREMIKLMEGNIEAEFELRKKIQT